MLEWVRFVLFCALLLMAACFLFMSLIGVNRFRFSLNRLHAASVNDTMGVLCIVLACAVKSGLSALSLKFLMVYLFMLITCPLSSHLISLLVYRTDESISREAPLWKQ
ncbi:MAG: monovalent cation/H(+) antiporter subunit G [Clostridia bacterium]|nr:monovalent cation/H(+) antiporter subunit G [Clostridia bacterium]MBQ9409721.1 monovalent cation/H(+) antiporter subunit G [Clostridia bacterium]